MEDLRGPLAPKLDYKSMSRITNTILSPSIPNLQYKKYLNGRLTLTLIIPSHPSRCESWNDYPKWGEELYINTSCMFTEMLGRRIITYSYIRLTQIIRLTGILLKLGFSTVSSLTIVTRQQTNRTTQVNTASGLILHLPVKVQGGS